jgi:hypothetical protein
MEQIIYIFVKSEKKRYAQLSKMTPKKDNHSPVAKSSILKERAQDLSDGIANRSKVEQTADTHNPTTEDKIAVAGRYPKEYCSIDRLKEEEKEEEFRTKMTQTPSNMKSQIEKKDTHNQYLTKYFDLSCGKCKSKRVLMSIEKDKIVTKCIDCPNIFEISLRGVK